MWIRISYQMDPDPEEDPDPESKKSACILKNTQFTWTIFDLVFVIVPSQSINLKKKKTNSWHFYTPGSGSRRSSKTQFRADPNPHHCCYGGSWVIFIPCAAPCLRPVLHVCRVHAPLLVHLAHRLRDGDSPPLLWTYNQVIQCCGSFPWTRIRIKSWAGSGSV